MLTGDLIFLEGMFSDVEPHKVEEGFKYPAPVALRQEPRRIGAGGLALWRIFHNRILSILEKCLV